MEALGCEVYMTRETHDVDISNQERAIMMNEKEVDLVLRIHCNGSTNRSAEGIGLYVNKTGDIAEASESAAQAILPAMVAATGAESDGIFKRDTYTGTELVHCPLHSGGDGGFMSNPEEDMLLNDPDYQQKLVEGMVEGICNWLER